MSPETCPNCGADVPPNARACPACGSDEQTGWSEQACEDALGLPDESFDYEEFTRREFDPKRRHPADIHWFWWIIAVLLLAGLFLFALH